MRKTLIGSVTLALAMAALGSSAEARQWTFHGRSLRGGVTAFNLRALAHHRVLRATLIGYGRPRRVSRRIIAAAVGRTLWVDARGRPRTRRPRRLAVRRRGRHRVRLLRVLTASGGGGGPTSGAGTPTTSRPRPTPHPSWNGDFSTGDWSQYDSRPDDNPDGRPRDFSIVSSPAPPGFSHAGQFTMTPDSTTGAAGQRTLTTLWPNDNAPCSGKTRACQGAETWYRDMIYFPSDFRPAPRTAWNWVWELHNYPNGVDDANLQMGVVTDHADGGPSGQERLSLWVMGGGSPLHPVEDADYWSHSNPDLKDHWMIGLRSLPRDRWIEIVVRVQWSWTSSGLVEWWVDGNKVGSYTGPNLYWYRSQRGPGQAYLQTGYYRPDDSSLPTVRVYHGATMLGPTAASVGEALP